MYKLLLPGIFFCINVCFSQSVKTATVRDLERLLSQRSDNIIVINFWATWCGPCVKELPLFESLTAESRPGVKVILVSLDLDLDPNPDKVYRFVSKKNIHSEVWLLDAPDPNAWINKIESQWSGALPATLLINRRTGKRKFIGEAVHDGELEKYLEEIGEPKNDN
jgi:thiol-disulfide isomerase/thioredoxin